jgi:hypothetical protein
MKHEFDIAILLPTRGRAEMLESSVQSLITMAKDFSRIQIMLGFDNDDDIGLTHFKNSVQPWLDEHDVSYTAMSFDPMGYIRLNEYVNLLANNSDAKWLVFWNDDAVMQSPDWDAEIMKRDGEFKLLAFDTHKQHPYSIFPIVPREWLDLLGYLSPHQISDGWLSQQAYILDIMERTDIKVLHDRHDLTGNNKDSTFLNRPMLENNPAHPLDFHNLKQIEKRHADCFKIAEYLEKERGMDITFFKTVFAGTQDPWEKLKANDPNKHMVQYNVAHQVNITTGKPIYVGKS